MTYFSHHSAAVRYSRSRPYFHPLVVDKIKTFLQLQAPVAVALDVACGTGLSTVALKAIARSVIGTDLSRGMLALAPADPAMEYAVAAAEALPVHSSTVDLVTVSLAFHWFKRERFLAEAHRVLRPAGWLVIYNNWFTGQMREAPTFAAWHDSQYLVRYPVPPRNDRAFTDDDAERHGFRFLRRETYANEITWTREELARYLTTQSNVIAMVEQGAESLDDVYAWLRQSLAPVFQSAAGTFLFEGYIWYLEATQYHHGSTASPDTSVDSEQQSRNIRRL